MLIVIAIIIMFIWLGAKGHSETRLQKIPIEFGLHSPEQCKQDITLYKRHLAFVKFSKFMLETLPWIVLAVVLVIGAGFAGFIFLLLALWFRKSLKDTNYRGYRTYKNNGAQHMRVLDEWLVVANQTILNK